MQKVFLLVASGLGALGVILGAFGAHYLKRVLSVEMQHVFEVGVRYHMYHVFALFAVALLMERVSGLAYAGGAFILGTVIFSGSLYILSVGGVKWMGAVAPIGGVLLVAGWLLLLLALCLN